MIDTKELREGNLGYSKFWNKVMTWGPEEGGHPHYGFKCPDDGIILCGSTDDIDPIPITPEWLERLGFKETKKGMYIFPEWEDMYIEYEPTMNIGELVINEWGLREYEYVHQLQNIVFFLTGEELKIKETV